MLGHWSFGSSADSTTYFHYRFITLLAPLGESAVGCYTCDEARMVASGKPKQSRLTWVSSALQEQEEGGVVSRRHVP